MIGTGKTIIEPLDFHITNEETNHHVDTPNDRPNLCEYIRYKADEFRLYLATRCCACLASIPSFALVIIAAMLIILLIATIPLAFITMTYSSSQARTANDTPNVNVISSVYRKHLAWPNESDLVRYQDWDEHIIIKTTSLLPANISTCHVYGFACTGQPHIVISKNRRCDGYSDCEDGSDELDCHECQTTLSCPASDEPEGRKICLSGSHLCDHLKHCPNGEDEDETLYCRSDCRNNEHQCRDADMCIPREAVCDGEPHCPFGDDEQHCDEEEECRNGAKKCGTSLCLPKRLLCDGVVDCHYDASDEKDCDCASCSGKNSALCNGDSKFCIAKGAVCDGKRDCPEGEDEHNCPGVCPMQQNSNILNEEEELEKEKNILNRGFMRCADNKHIHRSLICDGKPDCVNGTDEDNCGCDSESTTHCKQQESSAGIIKCYSPAQKCDGYEHCIDGEDERDCDTCMGDSFHCKSDRRCIPNGDRCDGVNNCEDESDEQDCTCQECGRHPAQMYMCSGSSRCFPLATVCRPYSACPNATKMDQLFCAVRNKEYF